MLAFCPVVASATNGRGDPPKSESNGDSPKPLPPRQSRSRRRRSYIHHCSRCGKQGHNVRSCPVPATTQAEVYPSISYNKLKAQTNGLPWVSRSTMYGEHPATAWYRQRCGRCGEPGHNAITCSKARNVGERCRVCAGKGRLQCGSCAGRGFILPVNGGNCLPESQPSPASHCDATSQSNVRKKNHNPALQRAQVRGGAALLRDEAEPDAGTELQYSTQSLDTPLSVSSCSGFVQFPESESLSEVGHSLQIIGSSEITNEEFLLAEKARLRARNFVPDTALPAQDSDLVGDSDCSTSNSQLTYTQMHAEQRSKTLRCSRCTGLGYLSCMACTS